MKIQPLTAFFCIAVTLLLTSCSSEVYFDKLQYKIEDNLQKGAWRISNFEIDGEDLTATMENYELDFQKNNNFKASLTSGMINGEYDILQGIFVADILSNVNFYISRFEEEPLKALNGSWDFISQSKDRISLIQGTSLLAFEKI